MNQGDDEVARQRRWVDAAADWEQGGQLRTLLESMLAGRGGEARRVMLKRRDTADATHLYLHLDDQLFGVAGVGSVGPCHR